MADESRPWVLGIGSSHNGAVCLLHGDEIVVAIQEERLVRRKRARHPGGCGSLAIRYCLDYAGITPADLDLIVLACRGSKEGLLQDVSLNALLRPAYHGVPTMGIGHHFAHAVGAFATSGFSDAAVLIVDGTGSPWRDLSKDEQRVVRVSQMRHCLRPGLSEPDETISTYLARGTAMAPIEKQVGSEDRRRKPGMHRFWSLGTMYASVARQIFGSGLDGAGKMMGLAPYGSAVLPIADYYTIADDGRIDFVDTVPDRYLHDERWPLRGQEYQDLAASTQRALEEAVCDLACRLHRTTGARRLCYAGGVALNSVANECIVRRSGFDEVFIMPAAEDSGTAIGAAYHGLWQLTERNTARRLPHDAVGRPYTSQEIRIAVERCPAIRVVTAGDVDQGIERAVEMLCEGKIIGWFHGRSELGPRALGQRSILCDPRGPRMKDVLNASVKFREAFRPFAPVLPLDRLTEWFETSTAACEAAGAAGANGASAGESPFMLRVLSFRAARRDQVPAVVHVDGTGRVQTVTAAANGRFHDLVERFHAATGCPVLLNTSFNVAGEPIVETPDDALGCLLSTGLDACVLEDCLVLKCSTYRSFLDLVLHPTVRRVQIDQPLASSGHGREGDPSQPLEIYQSFHLDCVYTGLDRFSTPDREAHGPVLRMIVRTPWGDVMHVVNPGILEILTRLDGHRTGWHVLESLRHDLRIDVDPETLARTLSGLRRASIVDW